MNRGCSDAAASLAVSAKHVTDKRRKEEFRFARLREHFQAENALRTRSDKGKRPKGPRGPWPQPNLREARILATTARAGSEPRKPGGAGITPNGGRIGNTRASSDKKSPPPSLADGAKGRGKPNGGRASGTAKGRFGTTPTEARRNKAQVCSDFASRDSGPLPGSAADARTPRRRRTRRAPFGRRRSRLRRL